MFVGKAGAYPSEKHLSDATRKGRLLASPTNIRQGWIGLPEKKKPSLLRKSVNYGRKKFYSTGPCCQGQLDSNPRTQG